jgi:hypothetical protein
MTKVQSSEDGRESSSALQELFYQYTHLPIGGKEIRCPYWRNRLTLGITGPFGGKGRPEQIIEATRLAAKKAAVNLNQMSEEEILAFMKRKKIGVDCSGFVFGLLDALDREKGGKGIAKIIPRFPGTQPERQASAEKLTSEALSVGVEKINEIQVGDMIRLDGGKHIAIILKIEKDLGKVKGVEYAHSSERTKIQGVHSAKIKIVDARGSLMAQEWEEILPSGDSYQKMLLTAKGDGARRLKIWA